MPGNRKKIAIIGAGPVGLAAAAHALERGHDPIVFEAGPEVGHAVRQWSHVRMFSPWEYNVDHAAARLLAGTGWSSPAASRYPTGEELVKQYLVPLSQRTPLRECIKTAAQVTAISRAGFDKLKTAGRKSAPFEVRFRNEMEQAMLADVVIDASGSWFSPNPAGVNGLPALGERHLAERLLYGMPDVRGKLRRRFAGKTAGVIGSGHSAIGNLIELARLRDEEPSTRVIWILRGDNPEKAFGGGANDKLVARGELGSLFARYVRSGSIELVSEFRTTHLSKTKQGIRIGAGPACCGRQIVVDELIVATGFRPDLSILSELRITLDFAVEAPPALAPLIDPNLHSCGTVRPHGARELSHPEPGFYIAGMKSYGRAPTFLMLTGYEQIRSIMAEIAGDSEAAERVELVLPETGVCTLSHPGASAVCCGATKSNTSIGDTADASAKESGAGRCA